MPNVAVKRLPKAKHGSLPTLFEPRIRTVCVAGSATYLSTHHRVALSSVCLGCIRLSHFTRGNCYTSAVQSVSLCVIFSCFAGPLYLTCIYRKRAAHAARTYACNFSLPAPAPPKLTLFAGEVNQSHVRLSAKSTCLELFWRHSSGLGLTLGFAPSWPRVLAALARSSAAAAAFSRVMVSSSTSRWLGKRAPAPLS